MIALLSDFGSRDSYAASLRGALARDAPDARLVDVTHEVPPGDVLHGAWVLGTVWDDFPPGTVFLCVVDPRVGSERRAVAVEARERRAVGPDNGLFTFVARDARAVALAPRADASPVFHGREVFAPIAARLARGARLEDVGTAAGELRTLPRTRPERRADGAITGHVVHVDRFGNCATDVPAAMLEGRSPTLALGAVRVARYVRYYAEAPEGELVALTNSAGHVELATRDGSAAERFGIRRGDAVIVRPA